MTTRRVWLPGELSITAIMTLESSHTHTHTLLTLFDICGSVDVFQFSHETVGSRNGARGSSTQVFLSCVHTHSLKNGFVLFRYSTVSTNIRLVTTESRVIFGVWVYTCEEQQFCWKNERCSIVLVLVEYVTKTLSLQLKLEPESNWALSNATDTTTQALSSVEETVQNKSL